MSKQNQAEAMTAKDHRIVSIKYYLKTGQGNVGGFESEKKLREVYRRQYGTEIENGKIIREIIIEEGV